MQVAGVGGREAQQVHSLNSQQAIGLFLNLAGLAVGICSGLYFSRLPLAGRITSWMGTGLLVGVGSILMISPCHARSPMPLPPQARRPQGPGPNEPRVICGLPVDEILPDLLYQHAKNTCGQILETVRKKNEIWGVFLSSDQKFTNLEAALFIHALFRGPRQGKDYTLTSSDAERLALTRDRLIQKLYSRAENPAIVTRLLKETPEDLTQGDFHLSQAHFGEYTRIIASSATGPGTA